MGKDTEKLKVLSKQLRKAVDAIDKIIELDEKEGATDEEKEAAGKDFLWAVLQIQAALQ